MKRITLFAVSLVLATAGLALSGSRASAVTLIYSNDVLGEIEPCGCRANPLGGMLRKANLMKRVKDPERLMLDAGDLLFNASNVPEILVEQSELQARYLLKTMERIGHDAVTPGEKDFALGLKTFERLRSGTKVRFLAANLHKRGGSLLLKPSHVFTRKSTQGKSMKIAVIGLVGDALSFPDGLKARSPIAAAKKEVARLRKSSDLTIALTHQGYDADLQLAKQVPGIDLIVGGHSQSFIQNPARQGSTLILQSSFRNQYIGLLKLEKPLDPESIDHQLVGLDEGYNGTNEVEPLVQEFKNAVAELNSRRDKALLAHAQQSMPKGDHPKFQTFPKCAECHLKQFDFWRKTRHGGALHTLLPGNQAKNKECLGCHSVGLGDPEGFQEVTEMAEWAGTERRLVPFEELVTYLDTLHKAKSLNEEVKVSRAEPGPSPTPKLVKLPLKQSVSAFHKIWPTVQCENCHQPGRDHPFSGTYTKEVPRETCLKCHTPDRAPKWYTAAGTPDWETIAKKRVLITCPAGEFADEGN